MVRTTSTSFISGTGLKKCRPMKRSGRLVEVRSSVIEIEEVLDAKMASFFAMPSSAAYIFFFSPRFSITASMMMSQSARSCWLVVPFSRARTACGVSLIVPFSPNLASDFSIPAKPLSRYFCSTSSTVTSKPAVAATCAMPEPIRPQPSTPTRLISIRLVSLSVGKESLPDSLDGSSSAAARNHEPPRTRSFTKALFSRFPSCYFVTFVVKPPCKRRRRQKPQTPELRFIALKRSITRRRLQEITNHQGHEVTRRHYSQDFLRVTL